eukprot:3407496-Pyramimonas_sp.AAC.1
MCIRDSVTRHSLRRTSAAFRERPIFTKLLRWQDGGWSYHSPAVSATALALAPSPSVSSVLAYQPRS